MAHPSKENGKEQLEQQPLAPPLLLSPAMTSRKPRIKFTPEQTQILIGAYKRNPRPNLQEKMEIAKEVEVTARTVTIFFMNHRSKLKREQQKKTAAAAQDAGQGNNEVNKTVETALRTPLGSL